MCGVGNKWGGGGGGGGGGSGFFLFFLFIFYIASMLCTWFFINKAFACSPVFDDNLPLP